MSRLRPRRPTNIPTARELTRAQALEYERTGWPTLTMRREFWNRGDVPASVRLSARPDPRVVLQPDCDEQTRVTPLGGHRPDVATRHERDLAAVGRDAGFGMGRGGCGCLRSPRSTGREHHRPQLVAQGTQRGRNLVRAHLERLTFDGAARP